MPPLSNTPHHKSNTTTQSSELKNDHSTHSTANVSFSSSVSVYEILSRNNYRKKEFFATWYTSNEIERFHMQALDTIRRYQTKQLSTADFLRGLECQTTRCIASKTRVFLSHNLILKEPLNEPERIKEIVAAVTSASEEEALEVARQDADEARDYQEDVVCDHPYHEHKYHCCLFAIFPSLQSPLIGLD